MNVRFECTRCGNCCRRPGMIEFTPQDIRRIAAHLDMSPRELRKTYDIVGYYGTHVMSVETTSPCPFLVDERCAIHEVKPAQCRRYPFWPEILESQQTWNAEGEHCPGIGLGRRYSREELEALARED